MESSNRIKLSLSKKLKEYANKMGRDHLGGDDIPGNKKKGGLRDNDGYDNVQYNRDMPQDESVSETTLFGEFLQEGIESVNEANVKSKDSRGMRFAEAIYNNVSAIIKAVEREKMDVDRVVNSFGPVLVNAIKTTLKHKFKPTAGNEDKLKSFYSELKELLKVAESLVKRPSKAGIKKLDASHREWWNHNGGADVVLNGKYADNIIESVVNEGKVDRVVGHTRYKYVGDGRKGQAIVSGPMKDREKEAIIKRAKKAGYNAKPNMGGGVTIHVESVNEATSKYPNFDLDKNIRYQSTSISKGMWRYTGKEQGGKGVYRNLNNNQFLGFSSDDFKYFKKHLKRHFDMSESTNEQGVGTATVFLKNQEELDEGGLPQNWMAGRTSDYHTKLRGKKRNYDDTNFAKMNTGQPDIEDEELDPDNEIVNEKFNKVEHLSLLNKALKAMPGSQNQKEIIRQLNVVRKAGGMRPLKEQSIVEYASRLTNAYILDDESVLDGTPEEKDAINRESAKKKTEKNYKNWKGTNETAKRDYKDEYKKFQSSTKSKKYRAELNKYNRDKGTYGNGDNKDASHKGGKIVGFESQSKNRGRAEKSRLKKK